MFRATHRSHTYIVRAVNTSGTTNSTGVAGTDANNTPGAPTITKHHGRERVRANGIQVTYTAGLRRPRAITC